MSSLWDTIQQNIKEGVQYAADKTEVMTKIGKIKYDIFSIKRAIESAFTDLGGKYYHLRQENSENSGAEDADIEIIIQKIQDLERQLQVKQEELEVVSKDTPEQSAEAVPVETVEGAPTGYNAPEEPQSGS
jgi:hypothetical protein